MFWDKTITLYNRYENDETGEIIWYRHLFHNCFVKQTNNKTNVGGVQLTTTDNIIRIPAQDNYIPPYDWKKTPNSIKGKKPTLQVGDLIFLAEINDIIDENTSGQRSSDLIAKYKALGSVFVTSVNINTSLPNAHYFVKGE